MKKKSFVNYDWITPIASFLFVNKEFVNTLFFKRLVRNSYLVLKSTWHYQYVLTIYIFFLLFLVCHVHFYRTF